ncbi:hypothetical protein HWV62_187 [Athelia sp. TMB]|nr:hypothetical protein HWV62_187 [Athelia sp. TMB]
MATTSAPGHPTSTINTAPSYLSTATAGSFMQPGSSSPITPKLQLQLSIPIPARDYDYYISDGNTVLLVESTLFKVHRSTLTKDKSTFDSMFSLDLDLRAHTTSSTGASIGPEGESDDNPIRLQGDTADEFRALLWALYALPHELMVALTPQANMLQLFHLSRITHKYQFRSIETWALAALTTAYKNTIPSPLDDVEGSGQNKGPSLAQITELAALCEQRELLDAALAKWKRLLGEGRDVALALSLSERLQLPHLLGMSYYSMLLKGRDAWAVDPLLTRAQRVRLLSGHYALSKLWERLPGEPPAMSHSTRCTGGATVRCNQAWGALWKSVLDMGKQMPVSLQYADVLGKMMLAESTIKALVDGTIPTQGLLEGMPYCKQNALTVTGEKVKEIQEGLADYFADVA